MQHIRGHVSDTSQDPQDRVKHISFTLASLIVNSGKHSDTTLRPCLNLVVSTIRTRKTRLELPVSPHEQTTRLEFLELQAFLGRHIIA